MSATEYQERLADIEANTAWLQARNRESLTTEQRRELQLRVTVELRLLCKLLDQAKP